MIPKVKMITMISDSTSEKCAPFPGVCHVGPNHTQAIGHHGNKPNHVLHMEFNN